MPTTEQATAMPAMAPLLRPGEGAGVADAESEAASLSVGVDESDSVEDGSYGVDKASQFFSVFPSVLFCIVAFQNSQEHTGVGSGGPGKTKRAE